jgi:hypothetical protein
MSKKVFTFKRFFTGWRCSLILEHLPDTQEALGSTTKERGREGGRERERERRKKVGRKERRKKEGKSYY